MGRSCSMNREERDPYRILEEMPEGKSLLGRT
jgi:hypothetical protein